MNNILTLSFLMLALQTFGQSIEHFEKLALASFYSKDFPTSLLYSEKIIELDRNHSASLFFAGEAARMLDDLTKAEKYLEAIPDEAKAGYLSATDFHLGLVKQGLDKWDEAEKYYESYLSKHYHENSLYTHLATTAIHSLATGNNWLEKGSPLDKLPGNINTEHAEMAPLRFADKLFFSTVLEENYLPTKNKRKSKRLVQRPVSRIYEAQFNRVAKESPVNPKSAILNASNVALMPDASRMYYTLCTDENPASQEQCSIWYRNRFYDGTWGPAVKLPDNINQKNCTNTQPSVGYDWDQKKYVLYFVSDRPGGIGGKDIWCASIEKDDTFGEPVSLPINTTADEVTPFFHQQSKKLYFSSMGWGSKGGFDIFSTEKKDGNEWQAPVNLGPFVNSAEKDELYYSFHSSSKFAYFVSGHVSGTADIDSDIFEARVFVDYQVRTFDKANQKPILSMTIEIEDTRTGAKGVYNTGGASHVKKVKLEPGTIYKINVSASGYQSQTFIVDTDAVSSFLALEENVFLQPHARP